MHKNQSSKEHNIHLSNLIKWYLFKADINWGKKYWLLKAIPVPSHSIPLWRPLLSFFWGGAGGAAEGEGGGKWEREWDIAF